MKTLAIALISSLSLCAVLVTGSLPAEAQFFIINGLDALPNAYPFFAHRYASNNPAGCGGSLIAQNWVLTAAHCIDTPAMVQWRVGSLCIDGDVKNNCGGRFTLAETTQVVLHPQYHGIFYDIGLVRLDRIVDEKPVSIDDGRIFNNLKQGDLVRSIGMGRIRNNVKANHLQQVDNLFLPPDKCGRDDVSIMCTNGANFGVCRGDSGSPNLVKDDKTPTGWRQVGVTAFGPIPCENHDSPDGLARVATVYSWIADNVCANYWGDTPEFCPDAPPTPAPSSSTPPPTQTDAALRMRDSMIMSSNQHVSPRDTSIDEYPWFTAIHQRGRIVCSGALVGSRYVVTAGHCVDNSMDLFVEVGYYCRESSNCGREHESIGVRTLHKHESTGGRPPGDMVLLELDQDVRLPVLPAVPYLGRSAHGKQRAIKKGREMILVGAGRKGAGDDVSIYVKKLSVKFPKQKKCRTRIGTSSDVTESVVCSIGQDGSPCGDVDSGSAVVVRGKGKLLGRDVIMALHNFGPSSCADSREDERLGHFRMKDAALLLQSVVCDGEHKEDWC